MHVAGEASLTNYVYTVYYDMNSSEQATVLVSYM